MTHPDGTVYSYGFDAMGRVNAMTTGSTTVGWASYGAAGEMTSFNGEVRTYNSLLQMTRQTLAGVVDLETDTEERTMGGRVVEGLGDWGSGYGYGAVNRLVDAHTRTGTPPGVQWSRTYECQFRNDAERDTPIISTLNERRRRGTMRTGRTSGVG
jgi:hypothetical protein